MSGQCSGCKDWSKCPGGIDWYLPAAIIPCPNQVLWLLERLHMLQSGRWPPDPVDTGYTGDPATRTRRRAYFETPVGAAAEVTSRLDVCGDDGLMALVCYSQGVDSQTMADLKHRDVYWVEWRLSTVVWYCSGFARKWLAQAGNRKPIEYEEFKRRRGISRSYHRR